MNYSKKKNYLDSPASGESLTEEQKINANIFSKRKLIKQIRRDMAVKITAFIAVFLIAFTFLFGVAIAPGDDMFPAVKEGDVLIYFRPGKITNQDTVIYEAGDEKRVGRVQATAGETVGKTNGGELTINGNLQPVQKRAGLFYRTYISEGGKLQIPGVVPEDKYLILGDKRDTAGDSREYGFIPRKEIKGKVFTIIRRRPL